MVPILTASSVIGKAEPTQCRGNACDRCGKCCDWYYDGDIDRDYERLFDFDICHWSAEIPLEKDSRHCKTYFDPYLLDAISLLSWCEIMTIAPIYTNENREASGHGLVLNDGIIRVI